MVARITVNDEGSFDLKCAKRVVHEVGKIIQ